MNLRIGQAAGEQVGRALRRIGLGRLSSALRPRDNARVVLLHGVDPAEMPNLRILLERLLEMRSPVAPMDFVGMCSGPRASWRGGRQFAVTFDDGLMSSYQAVEAVLDPLGLKAAFFIPTAILDLKSGEEMRSFCVDNLQMGRNVRSGQLRLMTRQHLLDLRDRGHAILSHTHSHEALVNVRTAEDVDRELRASRARLEDLLQEPVTALALPYGDDRSVGSFGFRAVEQIYDACFTSIPGVNSSRTSSYLLRRDDLHPWDSVEHVVNLCGGALDIPYDVKMWRLRRRSARAY